MTDTAIAEHIIYLVNEHKAQLENSIAVYNKQHALASMALSRDPGGDITFPTKPKPVKEAASALLDRITATLENRSIDELTNP